MNTSSRVTDVRAGLLDRPMPMAVRICLLVIMGLIPTCYVAKHHNSKTGFTSLIFFGEKFAPGQLPEVKQLHVAMNSPDGYDGQFYAQLSVDPLLREPGIRQALDLPVYRSQRFLLPTIAFVLGLSRPALVIEAYALLNLVFWFLLLGGLVYFLRAKSARDYLCISAILFSTGCLISVQRALTDLPMSTLGFYAIALSGTSAALLMCLAILTKPTAGLLLLKYVWPLPRSPREFKTLIFYIAMALAAPVLWEIYIIHLFKSVPDSGGNIGCPFLGWYDCVVANLGALKATPFYLTWGSASEWEWRVFEVLAPLSLMFQVFYLLIRRDFACAYWWMGIGFAVLFVCLTANTFVEQIAITRDVFPMTIAFNIQLLQQKGSAFATCFIGGNAGLLWCLHDTVSFCVR